MAGIELGAAYISILPSTDKLAPAIREELGKVEGDSKREGERSGSSFASSFKAKMGSLLKGGIVAGAASVAGLGVLGVKTAADMEQAEIGFTTMLGSAQKAKNFIADLNDFAAKTPFDFPGLQTAATSLISAGIATKDVLPIMTTLGDVTSGMGTGAEGIQRATVALQQMNAAGKVTGEDLNQLRDAGIPVFDLLSKSMGKTKAEVAKLAQDGKLGAEGLNAIMSGLKSGKGLERFSGLMEKQSQSLTGLWSTFKDTLGMGMAKAVRPLIPLLKDGLGGAAKALPPILTALANGLKKTITFSIAAVKWGKEHKTTMTVLASAAASLLAGFVAFKVVTGVTSAIKGLRLAFVGLNTAMVANPVGLIIAAIVALGVALFIAWKKSETFRSIVLGAFDKVKAAGRAVADFFTQKVPAAFGKVKDAAGRALGWVRDKWNAFLDFVRGIPGRITSGLQDMWQGAKDAFLAFGRWEREKLGQLIGFIRGLPARISSAASGMWDGLKDSFRGAINWIIGKWNGLSLSIPSIDTHIKGIGKIGGFSLSTPNIPLLAKGGILTEPTLNVAGEAGPEAVIPLDRLDGMLSSAAASGSANADARRYSQSGGGSKLHGSKLRLVVDGREFDAYVEDKARPVAEDVFHGETEFAGMRNRMR